MSNEKWLRYFRLYVATDNENKEALDLSDYRVSFVITQAIVSKPSTADIKVYNVSQETMNRIQVNPNAYVQNEKLRVIIEAGYENQHSVIFQGDLWWKTSGRENETDTYLHLVASSGGHAHEYAVLNVSIPKGATQAEVFGRIAQSMKDKGVKEIAHPTETLDGRLPRGKVLYGMSERALTGLCDTNGFYWGYGNEGIIAVPKEPKFDKDKEVIVLNARTGLIGRPKLTPNGVTLTCLLDSRLDLGGYVQIDNASVQREAATTEFSEDVYIQRTAHTDQMISADGLYRILSREFRGDTRGTDWYAILICEGVNASVKPLNPSIRNTMPN